MPAVAAAVLTDSSVPSVTSSQPTGSTASRVRARCAGVAGDLREDPERHGAEQGVRRHHRVVERVAAHEEAGAGHQRDPGRPPHDDQPGVAPGQPGPHSCHAGHGDMQDRHDAARQRRDAVQCAATTAPPAAWLGPDRNISASGMPSAVMIAVTMNSECIASTNASVCVCW